MISIIVDKVTTHNKAYPNSEPAAKFEAQFPGSIKPTVTNKPGPIYLKKSRPPKYRLWSVLLSSSSILAIFLCLIYIKLQQINGK